MEGVTAVLLLCLASSATAGLKLRNECPTYVDYFFRWVNTRCRYNDEFYLQTPGVLKLRNIPFETHEVTTEDGYILTVFRVLKDNPKEVIVLVHPIVQDSTVWFLGDNESYVMTFLNAGHEVWLVNTRGVTYSQKHVRKLSQKEYWNFSFHEIGIYDYPAIFRYINKTTGRKAISFSMSIGSSAATIFASEKPQEAKELVKLFVAMAVPAFMQDSNTLLRIFIPIIPIAKVLERIFGFWALFYRSKGLVNFAFSILNLLNGEFLFSLFLPPFVGGSFFTIDPAKIPVGLSTSPEATSIKNLYHFSQLLTNGNKFVQYDYGKKENLRNYNSEKPPSYDISQINVPFYIIFGEKDNLANKKGNLLAYEKLPDAVKTHGYLEVPGIGHADFLIGKDAPTFVINNTLKLFENL